MVENYEDKFFKSLRNNDSKYFGKFFQSIGMCIYKYICLKYKGTFISGVLPKLFSKIYLKQLHYILRSTIIYSSSSYFWTFQLFPYFEHLCT